MLGLTSSSTAEMEARDRSRGERSKSEKRLRILIQRAYFPTKVTTEKFKIDPFEKKSPFFRPKRDNRVCNPTLELAATRFYKVLFCLSPSAILSYLATSEFPVDA